uniref:SEC-C motif protein n=1 Tax=Marseillevirus LCMAC103 TaxID=2506604 RepID=A0A481YVR8_9VIRU|nr:MAG: SEC-C motif protein [Marseillevirus LCMAC103]
MADMKKALQQAGVDLSKLPKGTLEKAMAMAERVADPSAPSGIDVQALQKLLAAARGGHAPRGPRKKKIGPNEKCPCGSGKKYKKCCRSFD